MNQWMDEAIIAAIAAGKEILKYYKSDEAFELKKDRSPLTKADQAGHQTIIRHLNELSLPIISEEGLQISYEERKNWNRFWLIDPLDGTKEFLKNNDEFTVNIALIEAATAVFGVVYVPVADDLYIGWLGKGSYKIEKASELNIPKIKENKWLLKAISLPLHQKHETIGIATSRSHLDESTSLFLNKLKTSFQNIRIISRGSSLKLCLIAEGLAHIYPRFGPTNEWDTAAGHAVLSAAGGAIVQSDNLLQELRYNKADLVNPSFIAVSNRQLLEKIR